jgi:hypothetical protein
MTSTQLATIQRKLAATALPVLIGGGLRKAVGEKKYDETAVSMIFPNQVLPPFARKGNCRLLRGSAWPRRKGSGLPNHGRRATRK